MLTTETSVERVDAMRTRRAGRALEPPVSLAARAAWLQRTIGNRATAQVLRESVARAGPLIVDDDSAPRARQVRQSEFIAALRTSVMTVAGQRLAPIGQDADACVYLEPAFRLYASLSPDALEAAIERYAPGAVARADLRSVVQAVTAAVARAFEAFVQDGSFRGVPEEVRVEVHGSPDEPPPVKRPRGDGQLTHADGPVLQGCWPCGDAGSGYGRLGVELEEVRALPDWGSATFVGYHGTSAEAWRSIKRTGEFRPGGGLYGDGIYVVDDPWNLTAYKPEVLLEVGYVGLPQNLVEIQNANRNALSVAGTADVLHGRIPFAQRIYWLNGPSALAQGNFRVREHRRGAS